MASLIIYQATLRLVGLHPCIPIKMEFIASINSCFSHDNQQQHARALLFKIKAINNNKVRSRTKPMAYFSKFLRSNK
jgi:hypothetical protein